MDQFLVFPVPAAALNFQNTGFIPDDLMTVLVGIPVFRIPDDGQSPESQ
jgi:hypothetical protein